MVLHMHRKLIASIICIIMLISIMPKTAFAESFPESGSETASSHALATETTENQDGSQAKEPMDGENSEGELSQPSSQTEGQDDHQISSQPKDQTEGQKEQITEENKEETWVTFTLVGIDKTNNSVTWIENRKENFSEDMTLDSLLKTALEETGGTCDVSKEGIINKITGPLYYGFQDNTLGKTDQGKWNIEINNVKLEEMTNINDVVIKKGDSIRIYYSINPISVRTETAPEIVPFASEDQVSFAYGNTKDKVLTAYNAETWNSQYSFDVLGLARAGFFTQDQKDAFYNSIKKELEANGSAMINANQSSDNAKTIIALTAAGKDATKVGDYNLLEPLANYNYVAAQGINGPLWALIAFDCGNYTIPKAVSSSQQVTREMLIDSLLGSQHKDGGWSYSGASDIDMTAMTLQGLAPYYKSNNKVKTAIDKGLAWLSTHQNSKGFFTTGVLSSEAQSQVIVALTSLGIDPAKDPRFIKNGKSGIDALLTFYVAGGGYKHASSNWKANSLATTQGNYAITAYYRFIDGANSLYQMSDNNSGYVIGTKYHIDKGTPKDPTSPGTKTPDKAKPTGSAMAKAGGSAKSLGLLKLSSSQLKKLKKMDEIKKKQSLKSNKINTNKKISSINKSMNQAVSWIIGAIMLLLIIAFLYVLRRRITNEEE